MASSIKESGMTLAEDKCVAHLAAAFNIFSNMDVIHDDDKSEFKTHIHALQNIIMSRVTARTFPNYWYSKAGQ